MRGLLLAASSTFLLAGGSPESLGLRTTLSAETLRLPGREALGLVGLSTTAELGPAYLGPGLYGAARGERGGFFTFGLEGGRRFRPAPFLPVELEAGIFVGGGGGGNAPQGGGLMLRSHLGAAFTLGRLRLGAELSRVRFPNGRIDSTQAGLSLALTADRLWMPETARAAVFEGGVGWDGRGLALEAMQVHPSGKALSQGQRLIQPPFDLAGLSLTRDLGGPWFQFLSASGAARGSSAGYAQALAGLGLRARLAGPLGLEARLGAGMGGGGSVDSGGGFLISGEGSLTLDVARWSASAGLGFLRAPGGEFGGRTLAIRLTRRFSTPIPGAGDEAPAGVDLADWRVGSGLLLYSRAQRFHLTEGVVQIMTLRADRRLARGLYLTGEAGSAVGGGAGGYSTGLAGLGAESTVWARQRLFLEMALGAGGGGNLRTGGGLLASIRSGWRLELPHGLGLEAVAGKVRAPRGDLDTTSYGMGLHLRFKTFER